MSPRGGILGVSLLDLLEARAGIVCAVGAGGKKSVLQQLAAQHPGRVALTATVTTTQFPEHRGFAVAIDDSERLPARVAALDTGSSVAYACRATSRVAMRESRARSSTASTGNRASQPLT